MSATFQPIKPEKKKERFAQWKPEGLDREAHFLHLTPLPLFLPLCPPLLFNGDRQACYQVCVLAWGRKVSVPRNLNETVIMTPLAHCNMLNNGIY